MNFQEVYQDTCSTVAVAARLGNVDALKSLLDEGKPYDVLDNRGWTCIHEAAVKGHVECLEILLQLEYLDVDQRTFEWETPLILACTTGQADAAECLIRHGADVNAQTRDLDSSLCRACKEEHLGCVRVLISHGADVNQKYFTDDSPLHIAVSSHGNIDIVRELVNAGAKVKATNEHQLTPLFLAAENNNVDCLELFLDVARRRGKIALKKYVNMRAFDGATPLYIAAQYGFAECVDLLLKNGAHPLTGPHEIDYTHTECVEYGCEDCQLLFYPIQAAINANSYRCYNMLSDSLEEVLEQYDYNKRCPQVFKHHPFVLANKLYNLEILQAMLDKIKTAINNGLPNIFCHRVNLPASCVYLKLDKEWTVNQYVQQMCLNQDDFCTFAVKSNLLLMLKYGKCELLLHTLHTKQWVLHYVVGAGFDVGLFTVLKYLHGVCKGEQCIDDCILKIAGSRLPNAHYLMQLCLTPCISSASVLRDKSTMELCKERSQDDAQFQVMCDTRDKISDMLVSNSLQHRCRLAIVYQLVNENSYNSDTIMSLNIPRVLQDYLQFKEFGDIGKGIRDGFANVDLLELKYITPAYKEASKII